MGVERVAVAIALLAGCAAPVPTEVVAVDGHTAELDRTWSIVGNATTPGNAVSSWTVEPAEADVTVWLDGVAVGTGTTGTLDATALSPGEHELLFALSDAETAFARQTLVRSHPLYVVTSVDWDRPDTSDSELAFMDGLHEDHPALILTQFVGPYTFTEPGVDEDRRQVLVAWLVANEAAFGDEIGLHVHPYCTFVETTSVPCRTEPSFAYEDGDDSGYTIFNSAYTREENAELFNAAADVFVDRGLGRPTTFRAGGWTADAGVLHGLADAGFVADTSANSWSLMEEWADGFEGGLYDWNEEYWAAIDATSQPYWPSEASPDRPGEPSIPILEVPDNGILADYVTADEMIAVLEANWNGGALLEPTVLSVGFHNRSQGIGFNFRVRIDGLLDHTDGLLAAADAGPLIYERLDAVAVVWGR